MITEIEKENYGLTQEIEVSPSVNFHKLEEVVILLESTEAEVTQTQSKGQDEV